MSTPLSTAAQADNRDSRGSTAPLLNEQSTSDTNTGGAVLAPSPNVEAKTRKRDFWKQFTKADDTKSKNRIPSPVSSGSAIAAATTLRPKSPLHSPDSLRGSASPQRNHPYAAARDSQQHSPASSMIFERDVQEEVAPQPETSAHLPSHIITENHIPPALDDASEAITNSKLNPDAVEIVTHAAHQPASFTITGAEQSMASSMHEDFAHRHDLDGGSNYGSLESSDVRRLSFISFADVVHAEHEAGDQRRDSTLLSQPPLMPPRSPSPIRSPLSSPAPGTSPPTSVSAKGTETSPNRFRGTGSPVPTPGSPLSGELNIETMSQALKTARNEDLSGVRSAPLSAVGDEGQFVDRPFK